MAFPTDPTPHSAPEPEYSVSIGADLIAEALAAVEKREEESRAARMDESDEDDEDDVDVVFEEDSGELGAVEEGMTIDLGEVDTFSFNDDLNDEPSAADNELVLTRQALRDAEEALEGAELALRDAETERDEALQARSKSRRAAKKYKAAMEREAEQRKRLGSTQQMLRERLARMESRLEESEQERSTMAETLRTLSADQERYLRDIQRLKKREDEVTTAAARNAVEKTSKVLLPVLDNLELALSHADSNLEQVVSGVHMVASQFANALAKVGLNRVPATPGTPFDPTVHEAMQMVETTDQPDNCILVELQAGFTHGTTLLRAARVSVARAPEVAPPEPVETEPTESAPEGSEPSDDTTPVRPESNAIAETLPSAPLSEPNLPKVESDPDQT